MPPPGRVVSSGRIGLMADAPDRPASCARDLQGWRAPPGATRRCTGWGRLRGWRCGARSPSRARARTGLPTCPGTRRRARARSGLPRAAHPLSGGAERAHEAAGRQSRGRCVRRAAPCMLRRSAARAARRRFRPPRTSTTLQCRSSTIQLPEPRPPPHACSATRLRGGRYQA